MGHRLIFVANNEREVTVAGADAGSVTWDPMSQQSWDVDTLFLLDLEDEATRPSGDDGMIGANQQSGDPDDRPPWEGGTCVEVVPGRFRDGLRSTGDAWGYLRLPLDGLVPTDEFTLECWIATTVAWSDIGVPAAFLQLLTPTGASFSLQLTGAHLTVTYRHDHDPTAPVMQQISYAGGSSTPAGTWRSIAVTLHDAILRLYVDGELQGSATDAVPAAVWSDGLTGGGIEICGASGVAATGIAVSDLRISRRARVLGEQMITAPQTVTVDVASRTGDTINSELLGGLHGYAPIGGENAGDAAEEWLDDVLAVVRTDKLLSTTPIKAGAPDATHPTLGHSGDYSYDWQVVDRSLSYIVETLGARQIYVSLDATPSILGGSQPPYSGADLTSKRAAEAGFPTELPNDFAAFAAICGDLAHHVTVDLGLSAPYWGLWNEPDGGGTFWAGTAAQYRALYSVVAPAVKAIDPALQVGGGETAGFGSIDAWLIGLVEHCAVEDIPLDFVSWHAYTGDLGELATTVARVNRAADGAGINAPAHINGEWSVASGAAPSQPPIAAYPHSTNALAAGKLAAALIEAQRLGIARMIFADPTIGRIGRNARASRGLTWSGGPFATHHAMRLWAELAGHVVHTTTDTDPAIHAIASTDDDGRVTVLLASARYRRAAARTVRVHLPGVPDGNTATITVVDEQHASIEDSDSANLVPITKTVVASHVAVVMRSRSVVLVDVAPN